MTLRFSQTPVNPVFADNVFRITGSSDATKLAAFEVDGFTTGTTRTFTLPNVSGNIPAFNENLLLEDSASDNALVLQKTTSTESSRLYIMPKGSPAGAVAAALKVFADDYLADGANYRDLGIYHNRSLTGGSLSANGAFQINVKPLGTYATDPPDLAFTVEDAGATTDIAGRIVWNKSGGVNNPCWIIGNGKTLSGGTSVGLQVDKQSIFNGRVAMGTTPSSFSILRSSLTTTVTSGSNFGNQLEIVASHASASTATNYASLVQSKVTGTQNVSGASAFFGKINHSGTGTIALARAGVLYVENNSTGAITDSYGLHVLNTYKGSGALTNQYGIYIDDISGAATLNYAIYTGTGAVRFGDNVSIASGKSLQLGNAYTAGAPAATGYLTIKDSSGTTYKILVST